MKNFILISSLIILFSFKMQAQDSGLKKEVKTALNGYIKAGDKNNADALQQFLNESFRVVLYDGNKNATSTLDKATYSSFIREKKLGGYPRTAEFHDILFVGQNMATVRVTLTSPGKPTLKNFYSMVKEDGDWTVLQDFVVLVN